MSEIVSDLERLQAENRLAAAVVAVVTPSGTNTSTVGRVSRSTDRAPSEHDLFEIGSITKVFTALLVERLVRSGRLDWDAPISRYLPGLEFASADVAAITLRELATHRSGLPRLPDNMTIDDPDNPYADYGESELRKFLETYEPESLEKAYVYSNLGAGLLGIIAASATGLPYGDAMNREVLDPLGLDSTAVTPTTSESAALVVGFSEGRDVPNWDGFDALAGAGALLSSASDLIRFGELTLSAPERFEWLESVLSFHEDGRVALGWQVQESQNGEIGYWHNGGTGGYASYLGIRPDAGRAVVVLTASSAYPEVTSIGDHLLWQRDGGSAVAVGDYVGAYRLSDAMVLSVFERDGRLYAQATGQGAFVLRHEEGDRFVHSSAGVSVDFVRDDAGSVVAMDFEQGPTRVTAPQVGAGEGPRQYDVIEIDPATLPDYAGRYRLAPATTLSVRVGTDGRLEASVTGQPYFPVFPYEIDRFFYRIVDAQLHFERNADRRVVAVVLHQGGAMRAPKIEGE